MFGISHLLILVNSSGLGEPKICHKRLTSHCISRELYVCINYEIPDVARKRLEKTFFKYEVASIQLFCSVILPPVVHPSNEPALAPGFF